MIEAARPAAYPEHWEADVVLADGGTVHVRPITPADAGRLQDFHSRLSPQTVYYRFFTPLPRLTEAQVRRFTTVDHVDRVALVAMLGDDIVAVARYDRLPETSEAEVAFVVRDDHQGRGLGSVLLEHLAAIAGERGLRRFVAEVLPDNRQMVRVFLDAGYQATRSYDEGVVRLSFPIAPTESSLEVMRSREQRAESRSIARILAPRSVAVVGASRNPAAVGHALFVHLVTSGFQGPVYPVNPNATHVASVRAYASVLDIPDQVDVAVVATPAVEVARVVEDCAAKGVRGLVVVSSGFAETADPEGMAAQRHLVDLARKNGMRVVGPNCLGVINAAPEVRLNATLAPELPGHGRIGFFSQSGALGIAILATVRDRGLGLSTFVSAGNRADVSGNDLLQYWSDDPATDIVLLYLESFGNPRKFTRLARRLARDKPIVAVKTGRSSRLPTAQVVASVAIPDRVVNALFRQAGVIRVDTLNQMFDTAQVLAYQPLPAGRRVGIVGNSAALGTLAADACPLVDLEVADGYPVDLGADADPATLRAAFTAALDDPGVDSLVTAFIPPLGRSNREVAAALADAGRDARKPVVTTFLGYEGLPEELRRTGPGGVPLPGSVPSYPSPEEAVLALGRATGYADWRRRPAGVLPDLPGLDPERARGLVERVLDGSPEGRVLTEAEAEELLGCYGVTVWEQRSADDVEEAVAAAAALGYPVVLKSPARELRHRADLGGVRLDLPSEAEVRAAYPRVRDLSPEAGPVLVQRMAAAGVGTVVTVTDHPSFGALLAFGLAGYATELLGDRAYRILPMTDVEAGELVRQPKAAPLLFGYRGSPEADVAALEDLLLRVGRLADDLPELAELALNPVLVGPSGLAVLEAAARVAPPAAARPDAGPRRLRTAPG